MPIRRYLTSRSMVGNGAVIMIALFLISIGNSAFSQEALWPLRQRLDLSSGFGEFRQGRFHSGIDLRTGGLTGRRVFSPVDGYVWRVKMSYTGYGKGLYMKGDDGYVYVFAHLSKFIPKIDKPVKRAQQEAKRYYLDKYFSSDAIRVTKGELIAYSGQSGVGAPHLHFERRSPDNVPLNPLSHGYSLDDNFSPIFTSFGIELTEPTSLFPDGSRKTRIELPEIDSIGNYTLPNTLYSDRDFGIVVGCYDLMRGGAMKQTIYSLSLSIDNKQIYKSVFDTIPFSHGRLVNLEYDYNAAANGDTRVRRLYAKQGNDHFGGNSRNSGSGIIGPSLSRGIHHGLITAEDNFGNKAKLKFDFLWSGRGEIFVTDSMVKIHDSLRHYYFSATKGVGKLKIDSTIVELNLGEQWVATNVGEVIVSTDSSLEVLVYGFRVKSKILRLAHITRSGVTIDGYPFHGMRVRGQKEIIVTHEILNDGLLVTTHSRSQNAFVSHLLLYDGDKVLGTESPDRFYSSSYYYFFVPPREKYQSVSRLVVILASDTINARKLGEDDLMINIVGLRSDETSSIDDFFSIMTDKEVFFSPRFVEIEKIELTNRFRLGLNSDVYKIFPEVFATRADFDVRLALPPLKKFTHHENSGLCWLDEEEDRWIWLEDSKLNDNVLSATSLGGGTFAAVYDAEPPFIIGENIVEWRTYQTTMPKFEFSVGDSLSGIADDNSIFITIDRKWLIPEYDPERELCFAQPLEPLSAGEHVLRIEVTDRAGNKFDEGWNFRISSTAKPARGSK